MRFTFEVRREGFACWYWNARPTGALWYGSGIAFTQGVARRAAVRWARSKQKRTVSHEEWEADL